MARLLLTTLVFLHVVISLKFLAFSPRFANSHVNFMGKISDVLADAGHEVVMLSTIYDSSITNTGTKKARVIEVPQCSESQIYEEFMQNSNAADTWTTTDTLSAFLAWDTVIDTWIAQCNATIMHPGLIESLKKEKFDVAFGESMEPCAPVVFKLLGIEKWAVTESLAIVDANFFYSQTPSNPAYVPTMMGGDMGEAMSFSQRFLNTFSYAIYDYFNIKYFAKYDAMFQSIDPTLPSITDLYAEASLVFMNSEPLVDFPHPSSARIIDIGGIVTSSGHGKLDEHWSTILNRRNKTVFISFGTVAKAQHMPDQYKKSVLEVVKSFSDVTFIWKYENPMDRISEGIANLVESTWVPQNDLLHDPRLSAFVTHCGQGSTSEAISAGVPLVVIPVVYDQLRNAQQVKRNGHGIMVDKLSLETPEQLREAVREVLSNENYRNKALQIRDMIADRPFTMKETFVRNMEFLGKHGPLRQLDHYGRKLSFIQYYLIDVIAVALLSVITVLFIAVFIVKFVTRLILKLFIIKKKTD